MKRKFQGTTTARRHDVFSFIFYVVSSCRRGLLMMMMVVGVVMVGSSVFGQVIRVSKEAVVGVGQDVRLGDLAVITGVDGRVGEGLADLVILPRLREGRSVRAESILMAVVAQVGAGELAGRLQVSGAASCEVRVEVAKKPAPSQARSQKPEEKNDEIRMTNDESNSNVQMSETSGGEQEVVAKSESLAKMIEGRVAEELRDGVVDIRVSFKSVHPMLDSAAPAGKVFVLKPLSRNFVGSVQFEVQLVEDSRILQRFYVQVQVLKRESVLIATKALAKGEVVLESHVRPGEAWLDRQLSTLFDDKKQVVGKEVRMRTVAAGEMLDHRDFRPVEMVGRGEAVTVLFKRGGLQTQMEGVAVQSGKLHDSIQVRNAATNVTYQAKLIGKRLAVVGTIDNEIEQELLEVR